MTDLAGPPPGGHTAASNKRPLEVASNLMTFNKTMKLMDDTEGPKFLLINRIHNHLKMTEVSMFLIKNCITATCGTIKKCDKLRDGSVLIQTVTKKQAEKLIQLTRLDSDTIIEVKEHPRLNQSKGFISCRELKYETDEVILREMKEQHVIAIKRLHKKVDEKMIETGNYILTFNTCRVPTEIKIAFQKINVYPSIPLPLRCMNCLRFGHHQANCKKEKCCINCGEQYHGNEDEGKSNCPNQTKCVNCDGQHLSTSRECPRFIREQQIQKIKITEELSMKEAIHKYNQRNPILSKGTFASQIKETKICGCACRCQEGKTGTSLSSIKETKQQTSLVKPPLTTKERLLKTLTSRKINGQKTVSTIDDIINVRNNKKEHKNDNKSQKSSSEEDMEL